MSSVIVRRTLTIYGSVNMRKAKCVSELKCYVKSSSGNGSRDVAILQNNTSHTTSTKNVTSHMVPTPHREAIKSGMEWNGTNWDLRQF